MADLYDLIVIGSGTAAQVAIDVRLSNSGLRRRLHARLNLPMIVRHGSKVDVRGSLSGADRMTFGSTPQVPRSKPTSPALRPPPPIRAHPTCGRIASPGQSP